MSARIPDTPPIINHIAPNAILWSVMIPVYNCAQFLPELLHSLLPQAMREAEMQIEVVDDCSTDANVALIVETIGRGRVSYYRQPVNVGSLRNFETCLNRARGKYVHLLHGDDRLLPEFYTNLTTAFEKFPEAGAALCAHAHVNSAGEVKRAVKVSGGEPFIWENWLEYEAEWQRTQYVAMVVKRSVYERIGGFYGVTYGEDWEMWMRIASHYPVAYVPKLLAQYREHDDSISGSSYATGKNLKDITRVIDTINTYLPLEKRTRLKALARRNYAHYALNRKYFLWKKNHRNPPGFRFFAAVLKMHTDAKLLAKMLKFILRMIVYRTNKVLGISINNQVKVWKSIHLK